VRRLRWLALDVEGNGRQDATLGPLPELGPTDASGMSAVFKATSLPPVLRWLGGAKRQKLLQTYAHTMTKPVDQAPEPRWLQSMRGAATQRPRTQFVRIRWIDLQPLLRERDALWNAATPDTQALIVTMRESDNYAYQRPDAGPDRVLGRG
jgi:hypothetical protein